MATGASGEIDAQRSLRLSVVEGTLWAMLVGLGETSLLPDVVRLGGDPIELGLTITLPLCTGPLGAALAMALLRRLRARRGLAAIAAMFQALVYLGLAFCEWRGWTRPDLVIVAGCLAQIAAQAAGTAWNSWYGDLVPEAIRGRWFGRRNRYVHLATATGMALGGLLLHRLEPTTASDAVGPAARSGGLGFATVFALAGIFRSTSALILALSPEPRFQGLAHLRRAAGFLATRRGFVTRRLIGVMLVFNVVVYAASPYMTAFMLKGLDFDYVRYVVATVTVVVSKSIFVTLWSKRVDRIGPRRVLARAMLLTVLIPLPWILADGLAWVMAAQVLSGLVWSGVEVAYMTALLETTFRRIRPIVYLGQIATSGIGQVSGSLLGGCFLGMGFGFPTLFAAGAAIRILPVGLLLLFVPRRAGFAARPRLPGPISSRTPRDLIRS